MIPNILIFLVVLALLVIVLSGITRPKPKDWNEQYRNLLKTREWRRFRLVCFDRLGGYCFVCGRKLIRRRSRRVWNVHHEFYIRGVMPWNQEYLERGFVKLVCYVGCHAAVQGKPVWTNSIYRRTA
jgi:hypothetical protein